MCPDTVVVGGICLEGLTLVTLTKDYVMTQTFPAPCPSPSSQPGEPSGLAAGPCAHPKVRTHHRRRVGALSSWSAIGTILLPFTTLADFSDAASLESLRGQREEAVD